MSEQEDNVCEICGGARRVDWTISFEECHPVEMRFDPASLAGNWRLCPGHPEPAPKHDGNLGDDEHVSYRRYPDTTLVKIDAEIGELTPKQALSLLDWLLQERSELERLAGEQEQR